jgi:hypothetical protein
MTPKERFLKQLLMKTGKEHWVAALMLSAPSFVLKEITGRTIVPFEAGGKLHVKD